MAVAVAQRYVLLRSNSARHAEITHAASMLEASRSFQRRNGVTRLLLTAVLLHSLVGLQAVETKAARVSDECAQLTRPGETLKPRGGGRGWSRKFGDLDTCFSQCTIDHQYVVEDQRSGACYCWKADSNYQWVDDASSDDRVYDVSKCFGAPSLETLSGLASLFGSMHDCVRIRNDSTLYPHDGDRGWSRKHDRLEDCLRTCRRQDGFMYIIKSGNSEECYCYSDDGDYQWHWQSDGAGNDIMYDISMCFDLPEMGCPSDYHPGHEVPPKSAQCREYKGKFRVGQGQRYTNYLGERIQYDGTKRSCKAMCQGIIVGEFPGVPATCWRVEFDEDDGSCTMYRSCAPLTTLYQSCLDAAEHNAAGELLSIQCGQP